MSGLELLLPAGLIALLGIPLVVLFHMRHTSPHPQPVPTLRFWLAALQEQPQQARFRRPPMSVLLLLHLLIVAAMAFALTRPATSSALGGIGQRTEPQHVILLLDGSTSMSAVDTPGGQSRYEVARQEAMARIAALREGDVATVLILGTHLTTMEATDAAGLQALHDRLAGFPAPGGIADLNAALGLAKDLVLPDLDDEIVFLSDGAMTVDPTLVIAVGAPIEFVQVGGRATANVAVTDLVSRASADNPDERELYARIANFSSEEVTVPVELRADGISLDARDITLLPNGSAELTMVIPGDAADVTVTVANNDAHQVDNRASLVLAKEDDLALRILLVSDAPATLQKALMALPGAVVTVESTNSPAIEQVGTAYDLVVYDTYQPPATSLPEAPILFVNPQEGGLFEMQGIMPDPRADTISANDPLLTGVDLAGVTFGETNVHVRRPTDIPVVSGAEGSLIYRGLVPGTNQPMVVVAFDIGRSNLPLRVAFPILTTNIARYLAPSPLPPSVPLGEPLVYRPRTDAASIRIEPPAGDPVTLLVGPGESTAASEDTGETSPRLREVSFADTGLPGTYQVVELADDGRELGSGRFVVNAGHVSESDLTADVELPQVLATARAGSETVAQSALSDLWPALVAAAVALLALEWLLTTLPRRRRRPLPRAGSIGHA